MEREEDTREKLRSFLEKIIKTATTSMKELKFDGRNFPQLLVGCLYGSILEILSGYILCTQKKLTTSAPILLRSALEAHVDFIIAIDKPDYVKTMLAAHLKQRRTLLRHRDKNSDNPYLKDIAEHEDYTTKSKEIEAELKKLIGDGHKPLSVWERFQFAKHTDEYQSVYWLLCNHSHNDLHELESRHLEDTDDGHLVVLFKGIDANSELPHLDIAGAILVQSSYMIHKFLKSPAFNVFDDLRSEFEEIRRAYEGAQTK